MAASIPSTEWEPTTLEEDAFEVLLLELFKETAFPTEETFVETFGWEEFTTADFLIDAVRTDSPEDDPGTECPWTKGTRGIFLGDNREDDLEGTECLGETFASERTLWEIFLLTDDALEDAFPWIVVAFPGR